MIDNKFNKTERFLNIESNDIFFLKKGDKAVACKFSELEFYWPSFNGGIMLSKLDILTAEGKHYNKGVYPRFLYAHPEEIVGSEPYIRSVGVCFLSIDEVVEETGIEIPNFVDGKQYAIVYKWDGFKPVECRLSVTYDVLRKKTRFGKVYSNEPDGKFYLTREECAKDNAMKVVLFAK